jgi:ABC-type multidrug transport system ATPase subunit
VRPVVLELNQVCKTFRAGVRGCSAAVRVLDEFDIRIRAGECCGIAGGAGSGKSTLMLIAAGLIAPDRGVVRWKGKAPRAAGGRVSYVSDRDGMYAFLSAREVLDHHVTMHGIALEDRERSIADILRRLSLSQYSECRISLLPEGARRRLNVAKAMLGEPWLIILDETLDGLARLDAVVARAQVRLALEGGAAILLSSRDESLLRFYTSRIVALDGVRDLGLHARRFAASDNRMASVRERLRRDVDPLDGAT